MSENFVLTLKHKLNLQEENFEIVRIKKATFFYGDEKL